MSMRMETSKTDSKKTGRKVINMVSAEGFLFADAMMQKKNRRKNMLRKINIKSNTYNAKIIAVNPIIFLIYATNCRRGLIR